MGIWGVYSENNDDTLNLMNDDLELDQNKVDVLLEQIFCDFDENETEDNAIGKVGVVMQILRLDEKLNVDVEYLKKAILLNQSFLKSQSYNDWKEPSKRKAAIEEEIEIMQKVISTNGAYKSQIKPTIGLIQTILQGEI